MSQSWARRPLHELQQVAVRVLCQTNLSGTRIGHGVKKGRGLGVAGNSWGNRADR